MNQSPLEIDYLVVGAGATAMAFVDTLLSEDAVATVLMVDRHHRPGGHWNDAYPFVRLHQPSQWYGVASRELGQGTKDAAGFNAGLDGLASGAEVLQYVDTVMQQRFLASGRVRWLPMSEHACAPDRGHEVRSAAYTVIGSGKTGMDACLWLLENGVGPGRIRWITPH